MSWKRNKERRKEGKKERKKERKNSFYVRRIFVARPTVLK